MCIKIDFKSIAKISGVECALIIFLNIGTNEKTFVYEVENKILLTFDQSYIERDIRNIKKIKPDSRKKLVFYWLL